MTYFHRRPSTIIGAKAFHCPVRDGKEWDHLAMVVKRNRVSLSLCSAKDQSGKKHASGGLDHLRIEFVCIYWFRAVRAAMVLRAALWFSPAAPALACRVRHALYYFIYLNGT